MNTLMRHPRHLLVWICMATSLWMGAGWQWHGLSHVLRALDAVHVQDGAPEHEAVCEQCLQFASVDGAMPVADSALPQAPAQASAFSLQGGRVPRIRLHRLRVQSASGTGLIVSGPYRPLSNPSRPCPARSAVGQDLFSLVHRLWRDCVVMPPPTLSETPHHEPTHPFFRYADCVGHRFAAAACCRQHPAATTSARDCRHAQGL
jgi:hypothetical protein